MKAVYLIIFIIALILPGVVVWPSCAQPLVITNQPAGRVLWAGGNVRFGIEVNGTGPFTYQWKLNGTNLPNGIITTVAGHGSNTVDGGYAVNASLNYPESVAVDAAGNLVIADTVNGRIRKVNTNGIITTVEIITTVAGGGLLSGDGIAATNASLSGPEGVAVDADGNLFIAIPGNNVVRKVTNTQGPVLALNNVSAADAGNYQVMVTGSGGSVTSSVARLGVATAPLIYQAVQNTNGALAFSVVSPPGSTNVVLCAANLSPPVLWQPFSTNVAGPDGDWQFADPHMESHPTLFYHCLTR